MKRIKGIRFDNIFCSLRNQLILYFLIICLITLAIGSFFVYTYILDILKKNNEKYLLQRFSQADYNINNVINEVDKLSKLFLLDDTIQQLLQSNYSTPTFDVYALQTAVFKRIGQFISNYSYIESIYLFTENKGGIGGNEQHSNIFRDYEDSRNYFSSALYKKADRSFPKLVLDGGITEAFYNNYETGGKTYLITVARGVKPIYEPGKSATLIFNLDERYIASIYSNTGSSNEGYMYIVDNMGRIVSSSDGENIGDTYKTFSEIDIKREYGSFVSNKSDISVQSVYYRLKGTELYIVGDIPLKSLTEDTTVLRRVVLIVFTLCLILIIVITFFWLRKLIEPLNIVANKMRDVSNGKLGLTFPRIPKNEFGIVIERFNEMSLSIVNLINKNNEIQEEKRALEIEALQYQINPHFLYNTLNMIKWMAAVIDARNIVDSVVALGNILKPAFQSTNTMCTLAEEIEYLQNYIRLINLRFSNNICFNFNIENRFLGCKIPRLILQPIIENSITHGKGPQESHIDITVNVCECECELQIIISDNGTGIEGGKLKEINEKLSVMEKNMPESKEGGIGIYNVNRRMRLSFGDRYGLRLQNNPDGRGINVLIAIPMNS